MPRLSDKKEVKWADHFPELGMDMLPTKDSRVYQSDWKKKGGTVIAPLSGTKAKQYICCIVNPQGDEPNCYGVTVYRQMAVNATKNCEDALRMVQEAANYYEAHHTWPKSDDQQ